MGQSVTIGYQATDDKGVARIELDGAEIGRLLGAIRELIAEQGGTTEVRAHPQSVLAGAIGAALWGAFRARKLARLGAPVAGGVA